MSYSKFVFSGSTSIRYASFQKGDGVNDGNLNVCFQSGRVYTYRGVSQNRFTKLCKAPSTGKYYGEFIKGKYPCDGARDFKLERTLNSLLAQCEVFDAPAVESVPVAV